MACRPRRNCISGLVFVPRIPAIIRLRTSGKTMSATSGNRDPLSDWLPHQIGHVLGQDGPVFATLKVEGSKPLAYDYPTLYAADKRKALKAVLQGASP